VVCNYTDTTIGSPLHDMVGYYAGNMEIILQTITLNSIPMQEGNCLAVHIIHI